MPTEPSAISEHYLGESGKAYYDAKFGGNLQFGRLHQAGLFRPYCSEGKDLLDLGCSNGLFLRTLPAKARFGVEVNPTARDEGLRLSKESGIEIQFHERLDTIPDACVDVVISNHCLEHVPEPLHALRHCLRILRPGGTLALMVPFDDFRSKAKGTWRAGDRDYHLYTWSPNNLGNLANEAGFRVVDVRMRHRAWTPKIFWVHRVLGASAFDLACAIVSRLKLRREVFCLAEKPA